MPPLELSAVAWRMVLELLANTSPAECPNSSNGDAGGLRLGNLPEDVAGGSNAVKMVRAMTREATDRKDE